MARKVIHVFSSGVVDIADTTQVLASDWNATHILADEMTNRSGVTLAIGDVVAVDTANNESVVADDTVGKLRAYLATVGKISARSLVSVNNLDLGYFTNTGTVTTLVNGVVTRGNYLKKSATARALEDTGTSSNGNAAPNGSLAVAEESAAGPGTATLKVLWLGTTLGASVSGSTGYILFPLGGAELPDGTDSVNAAPAPRKDVSSTVQTANSPKVTQTVWLFDAAVDEHILFNFLIPGDYSSGGTLRLKWRANTAISGDVVWKGAIAPTIDLSTDDKDKVFNTVGTVTSTAPGTLDQAREATIALTMTNVVASRAVTVMIGRDADNASDTMAGDAVLVAAVLEYTK